MKVIICGAGRVGEGIATRLSQGGNTVTVIDLNADLIRSITTELDVRGFVGHGSYPDTLARAGIADADMIIAVTQSDEVNMVTCQVAHSIFGVPTKVARVRSQSYLLSEYNDLYSRDNLPIDIIISPEVEIGRTILRRIAVPGARDVVPFADGRLQLLGVEIEEDTPIVATPIAQISGLFPDLLARIVGIRRDGRLFAPTPTDPLEAGDTAYIITQSDQSARLLDILGKTEESARQIVIIGGGNIGRYVASELEERRGLRVRMIEIDKTVAETAATQLRKTVVLHGDAMSAELQDEAGVPTSELVLCLTDNDQTNILAAVLAKSLGARAVGALINEVSMQSLRDELDIDIVVDPRGSTVSSILRHVRRGRIIDIFEIDAGGAEVMEGEVLETSPLAGKTVAFADEEDGINIGAVIRDGEVVPVTLDLSIRPGDRIILLAESDALEDVEQLFRVSMDYF